jgi:lysophospholipase L1-like esterase
MNIDSGKKTPLKVKFLIFFISTVLSLTAVEFGLRLAGEYVLSKTQREYIPPFDEGNSQNHDHTYEVYSQKQDPSLALCVGDSFTNGGNVQSYDSYPYHLFSSFQKDKKRTSVLNFGKCESSTFDSYERIKSFIEKRKADNEQVPDKVIILTGSADLFGMNFGMVNEQDLIPYEVPILKGIKSLRLYKIYRFFKYEFFRRFSLNESLRISHVPVTSKERDYAKTIQQNAITIFKNKNLVYKKNNQFIKDLSINVEGSFSESFSKEVFPDETLRGDLYIERIFIFNLSLYSRKNEHSLAIGHILEFIKENSDFFWKNNTLKAVKYYFTQALLLQSKYTPQSIAAILEEYKPSVLTEDYNKMSQMLTQWDNQMEKLNTKRMETWDKLYKLASKNNIQLILQNYPSEYLSANEVIKRVAKKYNLPLVDNYSVFKELIERDGREKYLFDDDHCTPEGYEIMAKNIYNVMTKKERAD